MSIRYVITLGVLALVLGVGCKNESGSAPTPGVPAFPTEAPADPQQLFEKWKSVVTDPKTSKDSPAHQQLAFEIANRAPELVGNMIDVLLDPTTKPESRFLILSSLEIAQTPAVYPKLLDLTKPEVDPIIRTGIVRVLKDIDDPSIKARVRELTSDPERRVRLAALMVLTEKGDAPSRSGMRDYYFTDGLPPEHRARIIETLAFTPEAGDLKVFSTALNDAAMPEESRLYCVGALYRIADPAGLEPLKQCAAGDNTPRLKQSALNAAKSIEDKANGVAPPAETKQP